MAEVGADGVAVHGLGEQESLARDAAQVQQGRHLAFVFDALGDRLQAECRREHHDRAGEFRTAVVLRDVAGLDYAEIATVLEIPIGTVRSRIARGRSALAAALGNSGDPPSVQASDHA